ncbi:DUF364 domain-containing protein [Geobacter sp. AOG2]|uniref:DUF364 domain-containing protein n=1 Tax=Geobacter sp. AOG2 TaxID=1566347 RepID=UPI001CC56B2D|nr:DUF364 domain-containing protein [Geobacter sp. AOG2]GFE60678.1 hypothetical protein AOG2_12660 [Geobacter sp. AOG2]
MTGTADGTGVERVENAVLLDETAAVLRRLYGGREADVRIARVIVGIYFVGVMLDNGQTGIAYTPPEIINRGSTRLLARDTRMVKGMQVSEALDGGVSGEFAEVIRLALLNALSAPLLTSGEYLMDSSGGAGPTALFAGRRVCLVGAIVPLIRKISGLAAEIIVIDHKQDTRKLLPEVILSDPDDAASALAACDTAIFTGAAMANGTLAGLIAMVGRSAAMAVVGPSAGCVPDALFRRNVAMTGTAIINDGNRALDILAEGGGAYQLYGTCVRKLNLLNGSRLEELGIPYHAVRGGNLHDG